MSRPKSPPDHYLLGKVSALYYLRDQTQQAIAERLQLSRPTVSRLLREARDLGYVQITVTSPRGLHLDLETRLEDAFGLKSVRVVDWDAGQDIALLRRQLGAAAAQYLSRSIVPGETIGMAWGKTLSAMVDAVNPMPTANTRVVQILGGLGPPDAAENGGELVRRLAQLLDAQAVLLPAPGVVATPAVRDVLSTDPHVRAALNELDSLDTVFVGLGSLTSNEVLNDGHSFSKQERKDLKARHATGDIALRFFDADGSPVRTTIDDRILGITTEQLRKVGRVVAVAGGGDKTGAIAAGLKTKLVHALITDHTTAEALLPARAKGG
jgi:Transcriptional regulator, contains sigma factor-related N-terminal domain